jgi:hypothetical protein
MALTKVTGPLVSGSTNNLGDYTINNITGVAATFSGNLSVGGTITYQDVTSIDSVGIITAQAGIHLGIGATTGKIDVATGISTFTKVGIGTDNQKLLFKLLRHNLLIFEHKEEVHQLVILHSGQEMMKDFASQIVVLC